jgi:filamentous hemagglutinin family protein
MTQSKIGRPLALGRLALSAGLASFLLATASTAAADGNGIRIRRGDVDIRTRGDRTIIRASDGSIIAFREFSIGRGEIIRFVQPGDFARVLARVTGDNPSLINGILRANGHVYLVNPAGVIFSRGSVVNVGTIHAAAGHLSDQRFIAGVDRFTRLEGEVVNHGRMSGDSIHLIGDRVENHGSIESAGGIVTLLAGDDVLIRQVGERVSVKIDGERVTDARGPAAGETHPDLSADPAVSNTGVIDAGRGRIALGAGDMYAFGIHNSGTLRAARGEISAVALDGAIENAGLISTSVDEGRAGSITVQAPSIVNQGRIEADARAGQAGSVEVTSSNHTYLMDGSRVSASGGSGDASGGDVLVHSYDGVTVAGEGSMVDVSGGRAGGDGGFAEVSGSQLIFNGDVRVKADSPGAADGTLFLDPRDIAIDDVGTHDPFIGDGQITFNEVGPNDDISISDEALEAIIGHIMLQANRDIFVVHRVDLVNNNDVTLKAKRHIVFDAPITGVHDLDVLANWDGIGSGDVVINVPLFGINDDALFRGDRIFVNGGLVHVGDDQRYVGHVIIGAHSVFRGDRALFNQRVDDAVAGAHDVLIEGQGSLGGAWGLSNPVRTLTITGLADLYNASRIRVAESVHMLDRTALGQTIRITSAIVTFDGTIDRGAFATPGALVVNGDAVFGGAIGAKHIIEFLKVTGRADLGAGEVWTRQYQRYLGEVTLTSDNVLTSTLNADIIFGSSIDGPFDLFARTGAATIFGGPIGLVTPIGDLHTDAPGVAMIGGDIIGQSMLFEDRVRLIGSSAVSAAGFVHFGSTVEGGGFDLAVASPLTFFDGNVTGVGALSTDEEGVTVLHAPLFRAGSIAMDDMVLLESDVVLNAATFSRFGGVNGPHHVTSYSGATALFHGDVGDVTPISSLNVKAGDVITFDANLVRAAGSITLDGVSPLGRTPQAAAIAGVGGDFQIASDSGDISIAADDRFSVLGDLSFTAAGSVTVTDLSVLGDLGIAASELFVHRRGPSDVLNTAGGITRDAGTDWVIGGAANVNAVNGVTLTGDGPAPILAIGDDTDAPTSLSSFERGRSGAVNAARFFFGNTVLDLTPVVGSDNPVEGVPTRPEDSRGRVHDRVLLDPIAQRNLARMGVFVRSMSPQEQVAINDRGIIRDDSMQAVADPSAEQYTTLVTRLERPAILSALATFRSLFFGPEVGDDADLQTLPDRSEEIKAVLAAGGEDAADELGSLRAIVANLRVSGLAGAEYARSLRAILTPIVPDGMTLEQVRAMVEPARVTEG